MFDWFRWSTLRAPGAEIRAPRRLLRGLHDPEGFAAALGGMHEAIEDLTGAPAGDADRLVMALEHGNHGGMWAWPDGRRGHHVGVPPATWPNLVAAANRRPVISALVHELGHVAFWWDREPTTGRSYVLWGGATEGFATPVGTYACVRMGRVPAWIDVPDGRRDWASLADWANQWIRQGVEVRGRGGKGQDSVVQAGHGPGAAIVEAVLFDLVFNHLGGYDPLRVVLRDAYARGRTPFAAARTEHEKMTDFFIALGRAAGRDVSGYLAEWGFDAAEIARALGSLPALQAGVPEPPPIHYA